MIRHIILKDWKLLWPMVALVTLIQICLAWIEFAWGFFGGVVATAHLLRSLTFAWFAGISALTVAVVQQDAIPALDQDWLIRPLNRSDLVLAKLLFITLTVSLPMAILDLVRAMGAGFAPAASLVAVALKEPYVVVCLVIPVMALAATTSRMSELMVLSAALVVVYAGGLSLTAAIMGPDSCPTCGSGTEWVQHVSQHTGIFLGAVAILGLQYYRRATGASRALAVLGAMALVFSQMPWKAAFAFEHWLSPGPAAAGVSISFDAQPPRIASGNLVRGKVADVALATRALLAGNVSEAEKYVQGRSYRGDAPVRIELPLRITGLFEDELLFVDRAELVLFGEDGGALYRGADINAFALPGTASASDGEPIQSPIQMVEIPPAVYRTIASHGVRFQMRYSLTLMQVVEHHLLAAQNGDLQTVDIGRCKTRVDQDGISLRCKQIGPAPVCLSATLYGPGNRHNPEVLKCEPDYRPSLPALTDVLSSYGVDVPVRDRFGLAHYSIDPSELGQSYLLIKIYRVRGHFMRSASGPRITFAH